MCLYVNKTTAQWNMTLFFNSNSSLCSHLLKTLLWGPTIQEDKQNIKDLSACVSVIDKVWLVHAVCFPSLLYSTGVWVQQRLDMPLPFAPSCYVPLGKLQLPSA